MAKKKRRRSGGGADAQQRKQERLQARREAKERELRAQARREQRQRTIRIGGLVVTLAALLWFFFLRTSTPDTIAGHEIRSFDTSNGGTQTHQPPYNYAADTTGLSPPVSGRHNPTPAECGVHDTQVPDANFVHTLEHGTVAVLYQPDLPPAQITKIEELVSSFDDHTYSSPYKNLDSAIVVASWAHKMPLDTFDAAAIREYIDTFRGSKPAPEAGTDCPNTANAPFQPQAAPTPSPSPKASPEKSPKASPEKSPKASPEKSPKASPEKSPKASPG